MKQIVLLILAVFVVQTHAAVEPYTEFEYGTHKYKIQKLTDKYGIIWGISFIDNDNLLFTEKTGKIHKLNLKTLKVDSLTNMPSSAVHGQGGLLDIAVHPDFAKNKLVYVTYTKQVGNDKYTTAVARAELTGNKFGSWKEFFVAEPASGRGEHFGSRLVFDKKGYIFFGVGERGERDNAQKLTTHTGKIHRLKENGDIPDDNPFVNTPNAKKEIWTYGNRNPQGLFMDHSTGVLYESEHGPQGGDEINIIKKGANYGWPVVTYGKEYGSGDDIGEGDKKSGIEPPVKYFVPSIGPSGLTLLRSQKLPDLNGFFVSGSLPLTHLNFVRQDGKSFCELRLMKSIADRVRNVITGPDELLYVSTDSGKILRVEPAGKLRKSDTAKCPTVKETVLAK